MSDKRFASGFSQSKDWRKALSEAAQKAASGVGGRADLVLAFVSQTYKDFDPEAFAKLLAEVLPHEVMLACNASGVICDKKEVEMEPAVTVLAMLLPGVRLSAFRMGAEDCQLIGSGPELINFLDTFPTDRPHFILLADPATCDISRLLQAFNEGYRGLPVVGGLASGGVLGVPNWVALNGRAYPDGAVGVSLTGDIGFDVIVSQGCRPVGQPYVITRAEGNVLYELAGRSALVIGAALKIGQTMQFQLRDAETSAEDLRALLARDAHNEGERGALLVSCCGRGKNLYGHADHDAKAIQSAKGPLPLAGFFANGEIGPVGGKNYVHGYTSSLVILR